MGEESKVGVMIGMPMYVDFHALCEHQFMEDSQAVYPVQ
jgi:hypothetical protein